MKKRPYNFGAGPAMLPDRVLQEAQQELLDWRGLGLSVMEIGHRTAEYQALMQSLEASVRTVLAVPNTYRILFLGSPARQQFSMIPMNLLTADEQAGFLITGTWSQLAFEEAKKLKQAECLADTASSLYTDLPDLSGIKVKPNTKYLYYTPNETIQGVQFKNIPQIDSLPLVADMTSCIFSEPCKVEEFGLIFAGAQKNLAPACLTLIILREDLLEEAKTPLPTLLDFRTHIEHQSLYATPPAFSCYLAEKMLHWIKQQGGLAALQEINMQKAKYLYDYLDTSDFYTCKVAKRARSIMNVCFHLNHSHLENTFLKAAEANGLLALKGHRSVGGIRASLYNAMPLEGVLKLVDFMRDFSKE